MNKEEFNKFLNGCDLDEFKAYYYTHNNNDVCKYFGITSTQMRKVIKLYDIPFRTSEQISEITKRTNLEKYGVTSPGKLESSKEKAKKTKLERYGDENYANVEKAKKTKLEKYGTEIYTNPQKAKKTKLERYGDENYINKEKRIATCLDKYGCSSPLGSKEIRKKINQTVSEKYGVDNISKLESVKQKKIDTFREHYGVDCSFQADEIKEKIKSTNIERYGVEYVTQSEMFTEKSIETNLLKYGVPYFCMTDKCRSASSNDSAPNARFANLLDSLDIQYEREFPIGSRSYDFKVGNKLIEINPFATHNSTWGIFDNDKKDKFYHQNKSKLGTDKGYQVIHIWDWDEVDKILSLLISREKIYGRNCIIKLVGDEDTKKFLNRYHFQGYSKSDINIGLFYNEELVSIMTFGKPRYNKNYEYELIRYCSSCNVIGGAEKLFKYFVNNYSPSSIISYCDLSKFKGDLYMKLGFTLLKNPQPSKHWYNPKTKKHITDNLLRQRGFDQLFGSNYGKGTSNDELMLENGFVEIYDCGQASYTINL